MKKKHNNELLDSTPGIKQSKGNENLVKEIESLNLDVPSEIMQRIESDVEQSEKQPKISIGELNKALMSVAPEYKNRMRLSVIFACIGELFSFSTYFFSAYAAGWLIKNSGDNPVDFDVLLKYALLAVGSLLLYFIFTGFSTIISHKISFSILAKLRQTLFEKLKVIPMGYLVDNPVGKIKVIIMDRVADMEDWVAHIMPELPSKLLHPILCIIILFLLDWRIGLSIFVPLPIAFIGMATMMYKYRSRMAVWLSSYANVADRSAEYVRGIPVIKAFAQDKVSYGKFADAVKFYHFSTMKWWKQSWFGKALMTAAMMTPQIVSMPLAFYLYGNGQIGIETLILSLILPISILPQTFAIMMSFELFQMASNTWISIQELIDMPVQKRPDSKNKVDIDKNKGITFDNVSFSYHDGTEVLHNISFETKPGEVTALVGPSGGGKSTIAKLLAGFWDQSSGTISIGGVDTNKISFKQLAEEISFVSQDNFLFDVSIRDNIRLGKPQASEDEIIAAARAAHCHNFIMELPEGYDTKAGEAGGAMSGGERQRITLARAILKPASTIVLDEATAYADPENEALIQEALSHLVKGKNLVMVAHRLNTIKQAHQIILIDKGKIIAKGKHDELMKEPLYASLWKQYLGKE
ncbi:TPA: ABC transporter ATP-binding protein [Streptococcus agalactiae]|uniref:Multidrug resistance ABC transporter ATP-binding and permease protein n=2 Tax=Streptococcus dysgalactiae subsp. equisimilis TaxID=119602 RepID=A0AB38XYG9_STREQ|nr:MULTISPECIES: ABC transporter ATP-binding protein [Streptococcus]ADX24875.1 ABC transporter, ATP-binding/permease protein [Streptococcus dysgalactiae subsp. equisimilis ATCC 12394]NSQ38208.1 ABC transporter ATP-binding protein [Enterococcus faecalis]HDF4515968.1 ABC transporter ATP-binding protein [Staphylococcus aureus]HES3528384.1 ABC transporter ATP-binding protein [Streptococcus pyogenes]AIK71229.1 ABC transporter ATP-binding protein [Streptococcus agalactiae]